MWRTGIHRARGGNLTKASSANYRGLAKSHRILVFDGTQTKAMITQQQFDKFVRDFNEDYYFLLKRASQRNYHCLISSFLVLKDFYNMIMVVYDGGGYQFQTMPYPFTFRANDALLKQLGFDAEEIGNIYGFLEFVKDSQGVEFEEAIEIAKIAVCKSTG